MRYLKVLKTSFFNNPSVVYFNQPLGAVHSKGWSKYACSTFLVQKSEKEKNKIDIKFIIFTLRIIRDRQLWAIGDKRF